MEALTTSSPEETQRLGRQIAINLRPGDNILLFGDLGAGKTALIQGIANGLGITQSVKSPTFTYLHEYKIPGRSTTLAHYDLYRLPEVPQYYELDSLDFFDRVRHPDVITVVEWSERVAPHVGSRYFEVRIERLPDDQRRYRIAPELLREQVR